ncbi:hypothetical protein Scep_010027 [Stephania cephalantha]|uniref:Uncharacterized protein n=1 Tax=Stephania cephalantha TaxID=152367 RepID=A0AAP0JU83_9MAGN
MHGTATDCILYFGRSFDEYEVMGNRNGDDRRGNVNKRVRAGFHLIERNTFVRSSGTKGNADDLDLYAGRVSPSAATRPQANC